MRFDTSFDGEIVAARVRLSWRGLPIVQIQRQRYRAVFIADGKSKKEKFGLSAFKDAAKSDALDLNEFLLRQVVATHEVLEAIRALPVQIALATNGATSRNHRRAA